ncbi:hypothetical protein H113_06172 [Trichophyton rubrum MR1459]|uniref:Uncharacterized protein n=1 Tax=Trichophyton rubrum (strain ATCC MYA-4607 / CBS 118892) TaxID=559305 RepID=F2SM98_TRIRC|nr:uncharacterized protein TERG_03819 [Trichophyton rubrum CBS 118892]XP_047606067.1 uncharacterized protein TERG_03819 [Trichophyton rubrum CBS 118892]EZF93164.1 hypothetical protein H113_06172 [Trichophyton rubrum MR1459]EZG04309.1 hypothetical protein H106_05966 [Trichophyton rubrum CBS 735.88]EGD87572.2 hypothetical protein TERG_03819 [Trichophyton rubrum CBS 118892]EZF93165.1 hypothetical protein H113_06172 [Trichophyton rubrum MR1459]EZG04310.1 hypothetical protein H106_05966 [Trichophy
MTRKVVRLKVRTGVVIFLMQNMTHPSSAKRRHYSQSQVRISYPSSHLQTRPSARQISPPRAPVAIAPQALGIHVPPILAEKGQSARGLTFTLIQQAALQSTKSRI